VLWTSLFRNLFRRRAAASILAVPGAREVAVEFGSLSKTYSMPGWRIGYAVGSAKLIDAWPG